MTFEAASAQVNFNRAQQDLINDPTLSLWGKMHSLTALQDAANEKPKSGPMISVGDVARGAVGAGLGYGVGTIMGKMFGVAPETLSTFQHMGMGLGTLMNTGIVGMNKNSNDQTVQERSDAFRYGFIKAALDVGYFEKSAELGRVVLPVGPEFITGPLNAGLRLGQSAAVNAGGLAGQMMGDDETDVGITQMRIEQRALQERERAIKAMRGQQTLKKVLDRRRGRA